MKTTIKATEGDFFVKYLSAINGGLGLSQKEILILGELIRHSLKFKEDPDYPFSTHIKKKIQTDLKISQYNLNNYIQALKAKKAIYLNKDNAMRIHPMVIPQIVENKSEVIFEFVIN